MRSKNRSITIKDIARELKISISTVSRALRDLPDVNPETKKAVISMAQEMNYHPTTGALSLVESRPSTLGVIIPGFLIHFYASAISGIQHVASQTGYNVMICQSNESYETEVNNVRALVSSKIDGLIISLSKETVNIEHLRQLHRKGYPLVFFNRVIEDVDVSKVVVDDYDGAFKATEYLIQTGGRKIAHLAGPKNLLLSQERLRGYLDAMAKHQLPVESDWIIYSDFTMENGIECGKQFLNCKTLPDSIFCICDSAAYGVMNAFKEKGLKIPKDIAIIGFTDEPSNIIVTPTLSSIAQPTFEIGQTAANLFLDRIVLGPEEYQPTTKILKTHLVVRESTRKLPNS